MKRLLFLLVILYILISITNVNAASCSYQEKKELKELAKKVEVGYEYDQNNDVFNLSVYNLSDKVAIETYDFYYNKSIKNYVSVVPGNNLKISVIGGKGSNCYSEELRIISVNLPNRNYYYGIDDCKGHENFKLCRKWYDTSTMSLEEVSQKIKESYKDEPSLIKTIFNFIANNFVYIIVFAASVALTVVIIVYVKKKNKKLDL